MGDDTPRHEQKWGPGPGGSCPVGLSEGSMLMFTYMAVAMDLQLFYPLIELYI